MKHPSVFLQVINDEEDTTYKSFFLHFGNFKVLVTVKDENQEEFLKFIPDILKTIDKRRKASG